MDARPSGMFVEYVRRETDILRIRCIAKKEKVIARDACVFGGGGETATLACVALACRAALTAIQRSRNITFANCHLWENSREYSKSTPR